MNKKLVILFFVCICTIISSIPALSQVKDENGKLVGSNMFNEKCVKCHERLRPEH